MLAKRKFCATTAELMAAYVAKTRSLTNALLAHGKAGMEEGVGRQGEE